MLRLLTNGVRSLKRTPRLETTKMSVRNAEIPDAGEELQENIQNQAGETAETVETAQPILNIVSHPGNLKIPDFDGRTNWRLWKAKFERIVRMNGWETMKIDYLWVHFTGDALSYAEDLPNAHVLPYEELCVHIAQRFDAERLTNVHKAQLINRRRRPNETLSELGQSVRQLINLAYPNFNQAAKEEIAIEKFLDALKPELRKSIYQESPATLDEAMERGLKLEAWSLVEDTKHGRGVRCVTEEKEEEDSSDSEQIRLLKDLQTKVKGLELQRRNNKDIKCFYCGKLGHVKLECYSRKRDEGQSSTQHGTRSTTTCYRCGGRGHRSTECATPASVPEN